MIYNQAEALRYMGASCDDKEAALLADQVYFRLRNIVQPRSIIKRFACKLVSDGVVVEGTKFVSENLAKHLTGCKELLLFAATLGSGLDREIKKMTLESLALGNAAQAVAASLVEVYCNQTLDDYKVEPLQQRARFSPGYGDWALDEQEKFFKLLNTRSIGLTLTSSGMMAPVKSVTAVVGLGPAVDEVVGRCEVCGLKNCQYRRMTDEG